MNRRLPLKFLNNKKEFGPFKTSETHYQTGPPILPIYFSKRGGNESWDINLSPIIQLFRHFLLDESLLSDYENLLTVLLHFLQQH